MLFIGQYLSFETPASWDTDVRVAEQDHYITVTYRGLPLLVFSFLRDPASVPIQSAHESLGLLTGPSGQWYVVAEFPDTPEFLDDAMEDRYYELSLDLHVLFRTLDAVPPYSFQLFTTNGIRTSGFFVTDECLGCPACWEACPQKCINLSDVPVIIDQSHCLRCGLCKEACPLQAIEQR